VEKLRKALEKTALIVRGMKAEKRCARQGRSAEKISISS
jgi:hypothetical protein